MTDTDVTRKAMNLLRAGASIEAIAAQLGVDQEEAVRAISAALRESRGLPAGEARKLELARLDLAQLAIFPRVRNGELDAIDRWLAIVALRQRIEEKQERKATRRRRGPIRREMDLAIAQATHLTAIDKPAIQALLGLADSFDYLLANDGLSPKGSLDNVTGPTFLRYCESLGLTPSGRARLALKPAEAGKSRVAQLRAIHSQNKAVS